MIHHLHRRHQSTFADPDALKCLGLKKTQAQHYVKVEQIMKLGIARGDIFFIHFDGNPLWSYGAVYFYTTFIRAITSLPQIRQVARLRSTTCNLQVLSPTQEEHTNNPVQKPNFRGHAGTKARTRVYKPPTVLQDHQGRENKRTSVDLARGEGSGGSRQQVAAGSPFILSGAHF